MVAIGAVVDTVDQAALELFTRRKKFEDQGEDTDTIILLLLLWTGILFVASPNRVFR
jgi:hypothetical protein